jgi:hypothetical protein
VSLLVVLGRGVRMRRGLPPGVPVVARDVFLAAPGGAERLLVVGATADVAVVARVANGVPIAFAGARELSRLFALEPSLAAALVRLERGKAYPVDLGVLEIGGTRHPFLGTVAAGAGAAGGFGFPWAGRSSAVTIVGDDRTLEVVARAVVVANAQHWGRWTLAPRAAMNDSRLELQAFGGRIIALWGLRRALTLGLHGRTPGVRRLAATAAAVAVPSAEGAL